MRARGLRRGLIALLLVTLAGPVLAWGPLGHRLVGELAERELSAGARATLAELLADEPAPQLGDVANWADELRDDPNYAWAARLHFVNMRRGECRFVAERDCANGVCVVGAIQRFSRVLADPRQPRAQRVEALKFLVHFVGDIHQPLHAGHFDDLGGNKYQIQIDGRGINLHKLWDAELLGSARLAAPTYAQNLGHAGLPRPGVLKPARWAEQSCALIASAQIYPDGHKVGRDYLSAQRPLAEARIRLAAARLAALLEASLGGKPR